MPTEDELREAAEEEERTQSRYSNMSMEAEMMGKRDMALMMSSMASDEGRHAAMMRSMMGHQVEEIKLSGKMMEIPLDRPVPQVYGDWVNLAEDMKTKDPNLASKVNYNLGLIQRDLPGADEAKRWLTQKASELGI